MTARYAELRALLAQVPEIYRPLNWMLVLSRIGSALPTIPRLLPAHLRRFALRLRARERRDMQRRSRALKRMGVRW